MNSINSFEWNGDAIEDAIRVGTDSVFLKGFAQKVMGLDVKELYDALASKEMPYVDRAKTEMRYRGHMLTRTKFFLTDTPDPVRIYNYTGFQYASTQHYRCYADYPVVAELLQTLNKTLTLPYGKHGLPQYNHVIGTMYLTDTDGIGYHSDKTKSWAEDSGVSILSLGSTREFHLQKIQDQHTQVFVCEAGDLFVLGPQDNATHKHAIVPVREEKTLEKTRDISPRISLCFRNIAEAWTRTELLKKISASSKAKDARDTRKVHLRTLKLAKKSFSLVLAELLARLPS